MTTSILKDLEDTLQSGDCVGYLDSEDVIKDVCEYLCKYHINSLVPYTYVLNASFSETKFKEIFKSAPECILSFMIENKYAVSAGYCIYENEGRIPAYFLTAKFKQKVYKALPEDFYL
jgi:hypothetical protein